MAMASGTPSRSFCSLLTVCAMMLAPSWVPPSSNCSPISSLPNSFAAPLGVATLVKALPAPLATMAASAPMKPRAPRGAVMIAAKRALAVAISSIACAGVLPSAINF